MAGRHRKPAADQLPLDYESAYRERHAQLVSAVRIMGLAKYLPLARLVFNMQSKTGTPLAWPISRYAEEFAVDARTVQRWLTKLTSAGLIEVNQRPRASGRHDTNLVSINWATVTLLAVNRPGDAPVWHRVAKCHPLGGKMPGVGGKMPPSNKEYPSCIPSKDPSEKNHHHQKPVATEDDHALACQQAVVEVSDQEPVSTEDDHALAWEQAVVEVSLCGVGQHERAVSNVRRHGGTPDAVRELVAEFRRLSERWCEANRPVVLYRRLVSWRPDQAVAEGWPPADKRARDAELGKW